MIIDGKFKNDIQACFSKKESKITLENQLADIPKRMHQAFINNNAINVNDSFINLKVRDNINIALESTGKINHTNKNDNKNANTKIQKKTESKLSKTLHIRVQPIPGGKIEDIQQNLKDLSHEDLEIVIHASTNNATTDTPQMTVHKLITLKRNIEGSLSKSRVIISKLIVRTDKTKANTTIRKTNRLIKELQIQTVYNSNISEKHLEKRGLCLNQDGNSFRQ